MIRKEVIGRKMQTVRTFHSFRSDNVHAHLKDRGTVLIALFSGITIIFAITCSKTCCSAQMG